MVTGSDRDETYTSAVAETASLAIKSTVAETANLTIRDGNTHLIRTVKVTSI